MRLAILIIVFMAGLTSLSSARAQEAVDRCRDDDGIDRCDPEQHARVLALFDLPPIEQLQAAGAQVRRVFYVDGYGNDRVAVSFVRGRGSDPIVQIDVPNHPGASPTAPLSAAVPQAVWDQVLEQSLHFARELVALPVDPAIICLHTWVLTVEATDPPVEENEAPILRRRVANACEDGLAEEYAWEVARLAVPLFPPCAILDRELHRNEPTLLEVCASLTGDRLAAAEVTNIARPYQAGNRLPEMGREFDPNGELVWNGEPVASRRVSFWRDRISAMDYVDFEVTQAHGETSTQVWLRGWLLTAEHGDQEATHLRAPFEQEWVWDYWRYVARRTTVGAFEPYDPAAN